MKAKRRADLPMVVHESPSAMMLIFEAAVFCHTPGPSQTASAACKMTL